MKQVHYKTQVVKLTARRTHGGKLSILQSFLKKIITSVLSTVVFQQVLSVPGPDTNIFSCDETLTQD